MGQTPPPGTLLTGRIVNYDVTGGYGFVRCPEVTSGDVYFNRAAMPSEVQGHDRSQLVGRGVDFELMITPDGKARAAVLEMLGERRRGRDDKRKRARDPGHRESGPPPEPLEPEVLEEMTLFLEGKDGAMDYGKFANSFPGVKKSQLTPHFELVAESGKVGGRWQITLIGAEPMTIEEREAREATEEASKPPNEDQDDADLSPDPGRDYPSEPEPELRESSPEPTLVPSATLRLAGNVARWDERKGYGFIAVEGMNDVFVHKKDLPPVVLGWKGGLQDCEVTFEIEEGPDGKSKARDVHMLLRPDGAGGWQLRRP